MCTLIFDCFFFFSSRRRHTRLTCDWSSDVCSSDLFAVVCCSMAGFALARTRFAGRRVVLGLLLIGLLVPPQVLMVPMFQEFASIGLTNTYWALILPSVAVPVAVFVFMSFFGGIPAELSDAARVD